MNLDAIDEVLREGGFGQIVRDDALLTLRLHQLQAAFALGMRHVNPRFRFFFIMDGTVNGIAHTNFWHSYAGLTCGSVFLLEDLWHLILASNHVLPRLPGGKDNEQLRQDLLTGFHLCTFGNEPSDFSEDFFSRAKASDEPARAELAYRLFRTSLLFLYYHELAHLCRGHPTLCQAAGSPAVILEAAGTARHFASSPRQWAEMEADWLAAIWLLQNHDWQQDQAKNIDLLFELFLGLGLVFLIFSLAEKKAGAKEADHPPPSLRLAHIVESSKNFLKEGERYPFADHLPIQAAAQKALEELAIVARLGNFDWYETALVETPDVQQQILDIRLKAGRVWVESANRNMRRLIKRPPPKITPSVL